MVPMVATVQYYYSPASSTIRNSVCLIQSQQQTVEMVIWVWEVARMAWWSCVGRALARKQAKVEHLRVELLAAMYVMT